MTNALKHALATTLESIYIENHPYHRSSGMSPAGLLGWGLRMGLISQSEFMEALDAAMENTK